MSFTDKQTQAQYQGVCDECLGLISPGAFIKRLSLTGKWVHAQCPEPAKDIHPTCQKCWLVHPEGECP